MNKAKDPAAYEKKSGSIVTTLEALLDKALTEAVKGGAEKQECVMLPLVPLDCHSDCVFALPSSEGLESTATDTDASPMCRGFRTSSSLFAHVFVRV